MMEEDLGGVLDGAAIRPPRLEDAGLEDCALPPESIMEAFSRAAISLRSRISNVAATGEQEEKSEDGACVQDPGPSNGEVPDALLGGGTTESSASLLSCGSDGGVEDEEEGGKSGQDKVVVVGGDGEGDLASDRLVVVGGEKSEVEGKRSCVEGIEQGVFGGEKKREHDEEQEEADEGDGDRPILIEALI
ncbi:uncharacterized protein [Elaeis guineensis]|uniref:uncharacterized protein n=1 Tax=Elaeis guineensis var. tenera TaxID=51953 RepID=UPI003C6D3FCA